MSIKRFSDRHPPDLSRWFAGTGKTFSREVWARDNCAVVSGPDLSVKLISVPEKLFSVPDRLTREVWIITLGVCHRSRTPLVCSPPTTSRTLQNFQPAILRPRPQPQFSSPSYINYMCSVANGQIIQSISLQNSFACSRQIVA